MVPNLDVKVLFHKCINNNYFVLFYNSQERCDIYVIQLSISLYREAQETNMKTTECLKHSRNLINLITW